MPLTTNNSRYITWTPGTGTAWNLRWRVSTSTMWNYYPIVLNSPNALFAVIVSDDPYPPGTYVGVLSIGNRYIVEIQNICSGTSRSAWSTPYDFDTFLTCPVLTFAPTFTIPDPTLHPERVVFDFTFDCGGSIIYPTLELKYKKSTDMVFTHVPYPRNNTTLSLSLPTSIGTYGFILSSKCDDTASTVDSPMSIYTF